MPAPRHVLVCPQEFKGTLDAFAAADAIARAVRATLPGAEVTVQPMSDGGPGTARLLREARGGVEVTCPAHDALARPIEATYTLIAGPGGDAGALAVIESAATAGLALLAPEERDVARATSLGVGDQIRHAVREGAQRIIVGVGGTASNDGGAGALTALGYRLLDAQDRLLPQGGLALEALDHIDATAVEPVLRGCTLRVAADVTNPLLGTEGATLTYGPQKCPPPEPDLELLLRIEGALQRWVQVISTNLGARVAQLEGGGAGGGLAAGLAATSYLTGARIEPGAALVAVEVGLPTLLGRADLVITGEGRLDAQTGYGKTVAYVAQQAATAGVPCVAVAGAVDELPAHMADAEASATSPDGPLPGSEEAAMQVMAATERLLRRWIGD